MKKEILELIEYRLKEADDSISLFDKEFIKKGIFDNELSKTLHRAFELRQKGDYMEQAEVTKSDVDEMLPKTKNLVNEIKEHLLK